MYILNNHHHGTHTLTTAGAADLASARLVMASEGPTLPLAIPVLLLLGGLAVRAGLAPFHLASGPASLGASPVGPGALLCLVASAPLLAPITIGALRS